MARIQFAGVTKRFDDGTVAVDDLSLDVPEGEFMILVGPSGCGKTTALRMVAGFEAVTQGQIVLGDRAVNELDPADRDVAMVFQSYALFPHMSVFQNMAFPLRMRGVAKRDVAERVRSTARLLGIDTLMERKPHELSGGQRQRVAMGRALVRDPQAFLMDEPLSNLDAKLRTQMRTELARLHQRVGVTTLYVTHDQTEAMTLGTRVTVLREGVVQQVGTPHDLYRRPANVFVATFIGSPPMNLLSGEGENGAVRIAGAPAEDAIDISQRSGRAHGRVLVGVRPESWRRRAGERQRGELAIRGEVEVVEDLGSETMVYFRPEAGAVEVAIDEAGEVADAFAARLAAGERAVVGEPIELGADIRDVYLFDADSGTAIE